MAKGKLNTLDLSKKNEIINYADRNKHLKQMDITKHSLIPPNTLSTILKQKEVLVKQYNESQFANNIKRFCTVCLV